MKWCSKTFPWYHDQENDRDNLEYYHEKNYKENNEKGKKISYICTKSMK